MTNSTPLLSPQITARLATKRSIDQQRRIALPPYMVQYDQGEMATVIVTQLYEGILMVVDDKYYCPKCTTFRFYLDTQTNTVILTQCKCPVEELKEEVTNE